VIALFIDTNCFIELRDLKDLPWHELFPGADQVDLLVAPPVIKELDRFKSSPRERLRKRARLALQMIDEASRAEGLALVLRTQPMIVRLALAAGPRPDWEHLPQLDPSSIDDQIVARAASHGGRVRLFSHDTGPRIQARLIRMEAMEPPDDWLLPLEKSDDQVKVSRLEKALEAALSSRPAVAVTFPTASSETSSLLHRVPALPEIDADVVARLTAEYVKEKPKGHVVVTEDPFALYGIGRLGISQSDVLDYDQRYGLFKGNLARYFSELHKAVRLYAQFAQIPYVVENRSSVAAMGLRIETTVEGDARLLATEDDAKQFGGSLSLPKPPSKPKPSDSLRLPMIRDPSLYRPEPRDPTRFYWQERPKYSTFAARQCEDFRATRREESHIRLVANLELPLSCRVRVSISATNLPAPVEATLNVTFEQVPMSWKDDAVLAMLPTFLSERLSQYG
jgi:rRNA-processing protein FCF1